MRISERFIKFDGDGMFSFRETEFEFHDVGFIYEHAFIYDTPDCILGWISPYFREHIGSFTGTRVRSDPAGRIVRNLFNP
jgi:hypothetical protein